MLQEVLHFDGDVVGKPRPLAMQRLDNGHGVARTIEKIRIAEGDVVRSGGHLPADIFQHYIRLHHAKNAAIYRHHRTMPAPVFAAARSFGVSGAARTAAY